MSDRTFAISASTSERRLIFRSDERKTLLLEVLRHYRRQKKYLLHAFVFMPDHIHLLITPSADVPLEKCVQLIKGNFSFRVKKELHFKWEVWIPGFNLDRVKDAAEYDAHKNYIHMSPMKAGLVSSPEPYEFSSAWPGRRMDPSPLVQGLKPSLFRAFFPPG